MVIIGRLKLTDGEAYTVFEDATSAFITELPVELDARAVV